MTISSDVSIASIVSIILVVIGFIVTFVHLLHSAALRLQFNNLSKDLQNLKDGKTIGQKLEAVEKGVGDASKIIQTVVNDVGGNNSTSLV